MTKHVTDILDDLLAAVRQYEEAKAKAEDFGRQIRSLMRLEVSANKRASEYDAEIQILQAELREALGKDAVCQ